MQIGEGGTGASPMCRATAEQAVAYTDKKKKNV